MNRSYKFSVATLLVLTTLLSGCIFPGEWQDQGGYQGGEHGDRSGHHHDRGRDHGNRGEDDGN